jgi:hypothetical protein
MKRSCFSGDRTCLAFGLITKDKCGLGYEIDHEYDKRFGIYRNDRPAEPCPKPMTNAALCAASRKRRTS